VVNHVSKNRRSPDGFNARFVSQNVCPDAGVDDVARWHDIIRHQPSNKHVQINHRSGGS
jgi:hypothetical protein